MSEKNLIKLIAIMGVCLGALDKLQSQDTISKQDIEWLHDRLSDSISQFSDEIKKDIEIALHDDGSLNKLIFTCQDCGKKQEFKNE